MAQGNPTCLSCRGRGGWRDGFGWHRCHCTRLTKTVQDMLRAANARDDQPKQLSMDDMLRAGTSNRRA